MTTESSSELPTYIPSGHVGIRAALLALFVGVPTALVAGWFFVWARVPARSFTSVVLCDLIFLMIATVTVGLLVASMHSRSRSFNTVFSLTWISGLLLPWWLHSIGAADQASNASSLLPIQAQVLSWVVSGTGKILEATLLGAVPTIVARGMADAPYSEAARKPAEKDFTGELYWHDDDRGGLLSRLHEQGVSPLLNAPLASHVDTGTAASAWVTIKLTGRHVESDPAARWLDVMMLINERTEEGRIKTTSDTLVCAWQVSDDAYALVRNIFRPGSDLLQAAISRRETDGGRDSNHAPLPVELEPAYIAMQSENYATGLTLAKAHCTHPVDNVRADAYRLCALALARLERWGEAYDDYHELFEMEPSAFVALQLACTSTMDGQLLRAEAWFQRADEINSQTRDLPPPRLRTTYLSALEQACEWSACRRHLDWLANGYRAMRTLDSQRLWMADMPQLGEFLTKSQRLLVETMPTEDLREWYRSLGADLDEASRSQIDQHVAQLA